MTISEVLLSDFDCEIANTRTLLSHIPESIPSGSPMKNPCPSDGSPCTSPASATSVPAS